MDSETDSGCVVGTPSSTFTIDSEEEANFSDSSEKHLDELSNPVHPRPTPSWQLPITQFCNVPHHNCKQHPKASLGTKKMPENSKETASKDPKETAGKSPKETVDEMAMDCEESWVTALETLSVAVRSEAPQKKPSAPKLKRSHEDDESPNKKRKL